MALFSGQPTTVTTPDGRVVTLPAEIAAQFPGLQPAPIAGPPPIPDTGPSLPTGGAPTWTPADTASLAAQTPPAPPPDITSAPVTAPSQLPALPSNQGAVTTPGPDMGSQAVAPISNQELAKQGPAGTLAAQNKALTEQSAAINRSAQVEADTATQQGAVLAARDEKTQQILEERARAAAANQQALDARMRERDQLATQIANTKIDRSADHPILASIGILLGAIGGAMQQKQFGGQFHNLAFDSFLQAIDRKVAGQMQDLDKKRQALAQLNVGIGEQRQAGMDRLAEIDVRRDAALQQAKQAVETIATQMRSPAAMANAQQLNAKIDEIRATDQGQAAERVQAQLNAEAARKQAADLHAQSLAVQIRGQNLENQRFYYGQQKAEEEKMAALAAQLLEKGDKEGAAKAKDVAERAIWDPRTGDVQLNQTGQAKFAKADQLEVQARQAPDPATAEKQRQLAEQLRNSARINDGVLAPDKATAEKIRPALGAAQQMIDEVGTAVKQLQADPSAFDRAEWAGIKTRLSNIAVDYARVAGERVSVKAVDQAMANILSFDPDSIFNRVASQNKALESLKTLRGIVIKSADATLKSSGIKSDWKPEEQGANAPTLNINDKTSQELGAAENPGALARIGGRIFSPSGGYDSFKFQQKAEEAAAAQPGSEAGLSPTATEAVKGLAQRAALANDADRPKIIQSIAAPIEANLKEGGRNSLSWGMLTVLRAQDPSVYADVVKELPKNQADEIHKLDEIRAKLPGANWTPPPTPSGEYNPSLNAERYNKIQADRERAAREELQRVKARHE